MHNRNLRDKTLLDLPKMNSAIGQSTFKYALNVLFIRIFHNLTISFIFVVYKNMHVYILYKNKTPAQGVRSVGKGEGQQQNCLG